MDTPSAIFSVLMSYYRYYFFKGEILFSIFFSALRTSGGNCRPCNSKRPGLMHDLSRPAPAYHHARRSAADCFLRLYGHTPHRFVPALPPKCPVTAVPVQCQRDQPPHRRHLLLQLTVQPEIQMLPLPGPHRSFPQRPHLPGRHQP